MVKGQTLGAGCKKRTGVGYSGCWRNRRPKSTLQSSELIAPSSRAQQVPHTTHGIWMVPTRYCGSHPITFRGLSALSAMWRLETDLCGGGLSRTLRLKRMSADSIPASLRLRGHLAATWRVMREINAARSRRSGKRQRLTRTQSGTPLTSCTPCERNVAVAGIQMYQDRCTGIDRSMCRFRKKHHQKGMQPGTDSTSPPFIPRVRP